MRRDFEVLDPATRENFGSLEEPKEAAVKIR